MKGKIVKTANCKLVMMVSNLYVALEYIGVSVDCLRMRN